LLTLVRGFAQVFLNQDKHPGTSSYRLALFHRLDAFGDADMPARYYRLKAAFSPHANVAAN
jgi:hypothetical protein